MPAAIKKVLGGLTPAQASQVDPGLQQAMGMGQAAPVSAPAQPPPLNPVQAASILQASQGPNPLASYLKPGVGIFSQLPQFMQQLNPMPQAGGGYVPPPNSAATFPGQVPALTPDQATGILQAAQPAPQGGMSPAALNAMRNPMLQRFFAGRY